MKTKLGASLFLTAVVILWTGTALSLDPPPTPNPNGFISGAHYNLNVIGKKAGFTCPAPIPGEYGNVIYVPEYGGPVSILMESGKGARFATVPELQVTDACTFDDSKAILQLPKSLNGYWVFARTLAKPGTDGSRNISIHPDLNIVQDEAGNQLWYLGSLNPDGTICKDVDAGTGQDVQCTLTRSKGQSKAVNVTGIFEWSGSVCYFTDPADGKTYTTTSLCCSQADTDGDGSLEYVNCQPPPDPLAPTTCPDGAVSVTTYCGSYANEWVFNIADFVQYLWEVTNDGVKLVQVRFYPIP